MSKKRVPISLDDNDSVDIMTLAATKNTNKTDKKVLDQISESSGFTSRSSRRVIRKRSPYTIQHNFKLRPGMKEIFQEVGARFGVYDHTTFERALIALLEKENMVDLLQQCNAIMDDVSS